MPTPQKHLRLGEVEVRWTNVATALVPVLRKPITADGLHFATYTLLFKLEKNVHRLSLACMRTYALTHYVDR